MLYVYGARRAEDPDVGGPGVDAADVRTLRCGRVGALFTELAEAPAARRAAVQAHGDVLARALESGPVLPYQFGHLVPDEGQLESHLRADGQALRRTLDRLAGRVQLLLRIRQDQQELIRKVLETDPRLRRLRERTRSADIAGRIEFGEQVAEAVESLRAEEAVRLVEHVPGRAAPPIIERLDDEWLRVGLLVEAGEAARCREELERIGGSWQIQVSGPLPPYQFVSAA